MIHIPSGLKAILNDDSIDWEDDKENRNSQSDQVYKSQIEERLFRTLREELKSRGVPSNLYSLGGGGDLGRICLEKIDTFWIVYMSEKGKKYSPNIFRSYLDAIKFFIVKLDRNLINVKSFLEIEYEYVEKMNETKGDKGGERGR